MVNTLLRIGKYVSQSLNRPLGDLPQEHAGFVSWVQESGVWEPKTAPRGAHPVSDWTFGRGEYLVLPNR